jgi:hypothetical protein
MGEECIILPSQCWSQHNNDFNRSNLMSKKHDLTWLEIMSNHSGSSLWRCRISQDPETQPNLTWNNIITFGIQSVAMSHISRPRNTT